MKHLKLNKKNITRIGKTISKYLMLKGKDSRWSGHLPPPHTQKKKVFKSRLNVIHNYIILNVVILKSN